VLVVEDDPDIREVMAEILEDAGFAVLEAANGREALEAIRAGPRVALIFLDLMMPVMDGWAFRAEQLADPSIRDIPIVVLSGAGEALRESAAVLAAQEIVVKPFRLEELVQIAARHTAGTASGR